MPHPRLEVTCRPARQADTPEVLELTSTIWEGHDYVPHVWDEWLADPAGQLAVAEHTGRVVGLSKLTRIRPGEWWLEGLRVHPEFEGRGVAAQLHEYLVEDYWRQNGSGQLRLATGSHRLPVQHLCERTGFHKVGEYTSFTAPALDQQVTHYHPLAETEAAEAIEVVLHSTSLHLVYGLMDLGWKWVTPAAAYLEEAARQGKAWWWGGKRGLLAITDDSGEDGTLSPLVAILACPVDSLVEGLLDYRRLAYQLGYQQADWVASLHSDLQPLLAAAGFLRDWDGSVFVYEKDHPGD